jgi:DNA-3-methyladenine glycosylase
VRQGARLNRSFYSRDTLKVARELLGCTLRHATPEGKASGVIVETEGYLGHGDMASHARFGKTPRSHVLFGPPARAYVYFVYGMHYLFNVVTEQNGVAGAVLIRALEPLEGLDLMKKRRARPDSSVVTNGPGRLCQAMAITLEQNEVDLTTGPLGIWRKVSFADSQVEITPRIGVIGSREEPYRFSVKNNPFVSR